MRASHKYATSSCPPVATCDPQGETQTDRTATEGRKDRLIGSYKTPPLSIALEMWSFFTSSTRKTGPGEQ